MMDRFAVLVGSPQGMSVCRDLHRAGWRPRLVLAGDGVPDGGSNGDGLRPVRLESLDWHATAGALAAAEVLGVLAIGLEQPLDTGLAGRFPLGLSGLDAAALPNLMGPYTADWALIEGRGQIGPVLFQVTPAGAELVAQESCPVEARESAASLDAKLARASARLWLEHWDDVAHGPVHGRRFAPPRPGPRRRLEDGAIRWHRHSSATLDRWIRAHARGDGGAYFWLGRHRITVRGCEPIPACGRVAEPLLVSVTPDSMIVAFPDGQLRLEQLGVEQSRELTGSALAELHAHRGSPVAGLHQGRRVLTVAAHPDDEVLGAGGALIRHFKRGDEVMALIVCSADPIRYSDGTVDQDADARRAAHYLGGTTRGLAFPDQRLDRGSNLELIQALEREIAAFRPTVIYTHFWGDVNVDHARIAEAVDVAARPYSAPFVEAIYAFETPSSTEWTASARGRAFTPTVFVDIAAELERKLDAMACYESELRPYPHPRSLRALRERAGYWGSVANLPAAEALMLTRSRQ
ncbi:MAG TPA: PIG-L family deacetylase [Gemmatimonadales bacterium]|nr:PIG-L family deacetylase [Gemmatimonadales bacterium]